MIRMAALGAILIMAGGCAERGYFPKAKSEDIIACRQYASQFGAVWENLQFNDCMEEAGYQRQE